MHSLKKYPIFLVFGALALPWAGAGCERKGAESPSAPVAARTGSKPTHEKQREPLIKKQEIADWCPEHGVPESICTRCNPGLVEGFKSKGDWCEQHDLPESQCLQCHPEFQEKFEAMRPKGQG